MADSVWYWMVVPTQTDGLKNMLFWDVNNGISRRSWARNEGAVFAIKRAMEANPALKVTLPNLADDELIETAFKE